MLGGLASSDPGGFSGSILGGVLDDSVDVLVILQGEIWSQGGETK